MTPAILTSLQRTVLLPGSPLWERRCRLKGRGTPLVCSREDAVNFCVTHAVPCWLQSAFFLFTTVHSSPQNYLFCETLKSSSNTTKASHNVFSFFFFFPFWLIGTGKEREREICWISSFLICSNKIFKARLGWTSCPNVTLVLIFQFLLWV